MKIGFLINDLNAGGAERATASLASCFVNHGIHTEIITFTNEESFYPLDEKVVRAAVGFDEIKHSLSLKRIMGALKRMFKLRRFVKNRKLDILVGMSFSMTWYTVFCTLFSRTRAIGTERNNPYKYKASKFNSLLRKIFYFICDGYIFQTKKSALFFTKKLKKTDVIIPNAIFNENVYKLSPPQEREKVICAVGRLNRQKRFDLLIEAFSSVADKIPEYKLIIYGEGELRDELQGLIDEKGLTDRITLPGTNPNALQEVNKASVYVLSSDYEGMPNVLMEAMALGVPCISTRCDMGPEELIENGKNGILVDMGSSEKIGEAIMKILENPELAKTLSENSRKLRETHSTAEIGNRWIQFLKKII